MTSPSTDTPQWLEATGTDPVVTYGARLDRLLLASLAAPGIVHGGDWLVTQRGAGANMTVDIAAGTGIIAGTSIASQGNYHGRSTATVNVTVAAAPGSGTRTDLVVAQILDPASDGQTLYGLKLFTVAGADTIGTVPTAPANSLILAQLTVASGASSIVNANITDKRTYSNIGIDGWVNMTGLVSGWTAPSQPQARREGKQVFCHGALQNSSFTGGYNQIIAIDSTLPPPAYNCGGAIDSTRSWTMVAGSRVIRLYAQAATAAFYDLGSINYWVD